MGTRGDTWSSEAREAERGLLDPRLLRSQAWRGLSWFFGVPLGFLPFTIPFSPPPPPEPWHHIPQGGDTGQVLNSLNLILQEETKVANQPEVSWVGDPLKGQSPKTMSTLATGGLVLGNGDPSR